MTKLDALMKAAAGLPESDLDTLVGLALRLSVTLAPASDGLADDRQVWERASVQDMADRLKVIEAELPPGEVAAWIDELWETATPFRFDAATGELVEAEA
jgi:hypothetical protein